jgi:nucleotide-binding universal stress UspA family protein
VQLPLLSAAALAKIGSSMILLCYDGSADGQAAIDQAGLLMSGSEATVLVIWETILETMTRHGSLGMGFGMVGLFSDDGADTTIKQAAVDTAAAGVQRAAAAGLVAQPRIVNRNGDIAAVILAEAAALDARVIVMGTRGLGGVKSLMLGSVSRAVLHHADRAVLVVPSSSLAEQRHHWGKHAQISAGIM